MSVVALVFVHQAFPTSEALAVAAVAAAVTLLVRGSWSELPRFVARWLDLGVVTVAVLVATVASSTMRNAGTLMYIWPRLAALLASATLLGATLGALAYSHRRLAAEVAEQAARLAESRQRAAESRLAALSAQINPHFLFNTLNTLAEVVHEDEDQAEDLIADLAGMMRYALESSAKRVPLSDELAVVERLLRIESARLGDRLEFSVTLDPSVAHVLLPGLLIQPLVENAVQHGVAARAEGGSVHVRAVHVAPHCQITIEDDGPGLPPAQLEVLDNPSKHDEHIGGLANVAERMRLAWPDHTAHLTHHPGPPHRIVITLPMETA